MRDIKQGGGGAAGFVFGDDSAVVSCVLDGQKVAAEIYELTAVAFVKGVEGCGARAHTR